MITKHCLKSEELDFDWTHMEFGVLQSVQGGNKIHICTCTFSKLSLNLSILPSPRTEALSERIGHFQKGLDTFNSVPEDCTPSSFFWTMNLNDEGLQYDSTIFIHCNTCYTEFICSVTWMGNKYFGVQTLCERATLIKALITNMQEVFQLVGLVLMCVSAKLPAIYSLCLYKFPLYCVWCTTFAGITSSKCSVS